VLAGVGYWYSSSPGVPVTTYKTARVDRGPISAVVTATGTVNPVITVQVGSQVSGIIKALYADYNSIVKAGQVVALVDPEPFQAKVDQARASLKTAQSSLSKARTDLAQRKLEMDRMAELQGQDFVAQADLDLAVTNYRDAIQWVRDEVIRGANKGYDLDTIAENIKLPPHLAGLHYTMEFYGQVDWSAKGIYTSNLGWFDGRADKLYPMNAKEAAQREIRLMGGPEKVMQLADVALQQDDIRWSIHLLAKLVDSGMATGNMKKVLDDRLAISYEKLASTLYNLNGRGYLLESAYELRHGMEKPTPVKLDESLVAKVPLETIFSIMTSRLIPEKAMDVHETVHFVFPDENKRFIVTIRKGIAEVVEGEPLTGTPDPVAVLTTDAFTFRKMAMKMISPVTAFTSRKIKIQGSWLGFLFWFARFNRN
jgi:alkyl sulfatase BDS1-like metallo-beta-lactamase superfamily hydrolase